MWDTPWVLSHIGLTHNPPSKDANIIRATKREQKVVMQAIFEISRTSVVYPYPELQLARRSQATPQPKYPIQPHTHHLTTPHPHPSMRRLPHHIPRRAIPRTNKHHSPLFRPRLPHPHLRCPRPNALPTTPHRSAHAPTHPALSSVWEHPPAYNAHIA